MARLAARVYVDGRWWGPDDEVPAETAAKVTNRAAWADAPSSSRSAAAPRRESAAQESRPSREAEPRESAAQETASRESGSQESRSSGRRRRAD